MLSGANSGWSRSQRTAERRSSANVGMVTTRTSLLRPWPRASMSKTFKPAASSGSDSGIMSPALEPQPWMTNATGAGESAGWAGTGLRSQPRSIAPESVTICTSTAFKGTSALLRTLRVGRPKRRISRALATVAHSHRPLRPPTTPIIALGSGLFRVGIGRIGRLLTRRQPLFAATSRGDRARPCDGFPTL